MDTADWTAVDAALGRALDLEGAERDAFLASLDSDVRAAVERMLVVALDDDPLLDHPERVVASLADEPDVGEGQRVGPYVVEGLVGEGGMGRVYRGRRADGAFEKTVAVKVVRQSLALAGSDVAARLRRERALLATLDHPGIARLLDGGETDDGVPYLVTEFVEGAPITDWADGRGLGVRDRVRLMAEVARAVDHAHRRFIVHRDLKPSNVLVTERDGPGGPRPVVLDFGIAKLLAAAEDEGSAAFPITRTGIRMLTPAYAAPELYEPTATVTTAADVYGLGALLYELLTGLRPHDDAPTAGPPTTEPTRPSKAVTGATPEPGQGPGDPAGRSRALRGDLDTICLKALHPDPARRYTSAEALADDLQRYLDGRPVEARPDGWAYVAGRFVRRNRPAVAAAAVAVLALVGGLGFSLVSLSNERAAAERAERSADQATAAAATLASVFDGANPEITDGKQLSAREALDRGLSGVAKVEDPSLRGYLMIVLGETYNHLGETSLADSLFTNGIALVDTTSTAPLALADAFYALAQFRGYEGKYEEALGYFERGYGFASRYRDRSELLAARYPEASALLFNLTRDRAWIYRMMGRYDDAAEWAERAVQMAEDGYVPDGIGGLALFERGLARMEQGRVDEAVEILREGTEVIQRYEEGGDQLTAVLQSALSDALIEAEEFDEALTLSHTVLDTMRRTFGIPHKRVAHAWEQIGMIHLESGAPRQAVVYLDSAMTVYRTLGTDQYASSGWTLSEVVVAHNRLGQHERAERTARQALRIAALQGDSTFQARVRGQLGVALVAQGRLAEARPHLDVGLTAPDDLSAQETEEIRAALATARRAPSGR